MHQTQKKCRKQFPTWIFIKIENNSQHGSISNSQQFLFQSHEKKVTVSIFFSWSHPDGISQTVKIIANIFFFISKHTFHLLRCFFYHDPVSKFQILN